MKKLFLLTLITALAVVTVYSYKNSKDFQRKKYETVLKEKFGQHFHMPSVKEKEENQAADQPDMAAIHDFYMTMDPATGTVPRERLLMAYQQEKQSLKQYSDAAPHWTNYPVEMGGRTRALMFDPNTPGKVWAGGVTGGLWYNNDVADAGSSWIPVGDFWSCLSIRCLAYDPNNTNTFYLGTGEPETALITYRESSGLGNGIWKSTDGGATWNPIASTSGFAYITKIIVRNEGGNSVIYAGVVSGTYHGVHNSVPTDGLYRSTDGGQTWTQVLPDIALTTTPYSPADVVMGADGRIYVGSMPNLNNLGGATILFSDSGLPGSWTVYDSYKTIIQSSTDYPIPGRVVLGTAPSDPNRVYALIAQGYVNPSNGFKYFYCFHIAKSTDKGATWNDTSLPDDLTSGFSFVTIGWHAMDIAVDPANPDMFYVGGLDVHKTSNGGGSWSRVSDWSLMYGGGGPDYVHADQHIMLYKPGSSNEMILGCDGGVFYTNNATSGNPTFQERNLDYNTLQFYSADIVNIPGEQKLVGGLQDNGTELYDASPLNINTMLSGGDGAYAFFDKNEPDIILTSIYYNVWYVFSNGMFSNYIDSYQSGTFVNPTDYDDENNTLYANGCDYINTNLDYYCKISDVTGATYGTFIKANTSATTYFSALKLSPYSTMESTHMFLGTQSGQLFKLINADLTPITTEITGSNFPVGSISSIDVGASENELLVTFSNYGVASVWHTTDGGATWKNKESSLPDIPVRWGIFHPDNKKQVMLATETGIYYTNNFDEDVPTWEKSNDGMPNVRVDMLNYRESDNTVVAGTHGRGLFTTTWDVYNGTKDITASAFNVYPNPVTDKIHVSFNSKQQQSLTFKLFDQQGKEIFVSSGNVSAGNNEKLINAAGLHQGVYYLTVYSNGKKAATEKIIKID